MRVLITGLSGSGKTTVGKELSRRGYMVIEADTEPGLSSWINRSTGQKIFHHHPPYDEQWLKDYDWIWDPVVLRSLLKKHETLFVVGGAGNVKDFLKDFDKSFALYVDDETMRKRLQQREPTRWADNKPEVWQNLSWNKGSYQHFKNQGLIMVDSNSPINVITEEILEQIHD